MSVNPEKEFSRALVTQAAMAEYLTLQRQIKEMSTDLEILGELITDSLQSGASIEPGLLTAQIREFERRNVSWRAVVERLKGRGYAENVLKNTKTKLFKKLEVKANSG